MPKKLRLLNVSDEGYLVGSGETRKSTHVLIPHEALVALLTGLADDKDRQKEAVALPGGLVREVDTYPLADAARVFRHQAAFIAWMKGICSWNSKYQAVNHDKNVPRLASE